jgi:hypothetical protein
MNDWSVVENVSKLPGTSKLKVADLATGIDWTSTLFSKLEAVGEVHVIEISRHRLVELLPYTVDMFGGFPEKIKRYIGSFYALRLENESRHIVLCRRRFIMRSVHLNY